MPSADIETPVNMSVRKGGRFAPGHSGNPEGRPKGVPNKIPAAVAHMVDEVLALAGDAHPVTLPSGTVIAGGLAYLFRMATASSAAERGKFQDMVRQRMPKHVELDVGDTLEDLLEKAHAERTRLEVINAPSSLAPADPEAGHEQAGEQGQVDSGAGQEGADPIGGAEAASGDAPA